MHMLPLPPPPLRSSAHLICTSVRLVIAERLPGRTVPAGNLVAPVLIWVTRPPEHVMKAQAGDPQGLGCTPLVFQLDRTAGLPKSALTCQVGRVRAWHKLSWLGKD